MISAGPVPTLNKLLIDGEGWQTMAEGFGFADGFAADEAGNLYVNDLKGGGTWRVAPDGTKTRLTDENGSGAKRAPDGRIILCQGRKKRLAALMLPPVPWRCSPITCRPTTLSFLPTAGPTSPIPEKEKSSAWS